MSSSDKSLWQSGTFNHLRSTIREENDSVDGDQKKELEYLQKEVVNHLQSTSPESPVLAYIQAINALVFDTFHGGLSDTEVKFLQKNCEQILSLAEISEDKTMPESQHYGTLYAVLGQTWRRRGDHLKAAFYQNLAFSIAGKHLAGGKSFHKYVIGVRHLRLGYAQLAIKSFHECNLEDLRPIDRTKMAISHINALKFSGDGEAARQLIQKTLQTDLSDRDRLKLEWQQRTGEIQDEAGVKSLIKFCGDLSLENGAHYMLEAYLWARAMNVEEVFVNRLPSPNTCARAIKKNTKSLKVFTATTKNLHSCFTDSQVSKRALIDVMGHFEDSDTLTLIDQSMLCAVATMRYLMRHRQFDMARLCLNQYKNQSMLLTSGQSTDALHLIGDLKSRKWSTE